MQIHLGYFYGSLVEWWAVVVVMHEMMVGKRPFVNPDEVSGKHVQFPLNRSWNAVSILQGVSMYFFTFI
jgi:hypothetical protein